MKAVKLFWLTIFLKLTISKLFARLWFKFQKHVNHNKEHMVKLQEVMASLFIGSVLSLINKTALLIIHSLTLNTT